MNLAAAGLLSLWASIVACSVSVLAAALSRRDLSRTALLGGALLAALATGFLAIALFTGDFSIGYVIRTTSIATPWPYRVAALWGAMEGSLLFYSTLTLGIGALAMGRVPDAFRRGATPVIAVVGGGLLTLTALLANPFATVEIPAVDGEGLVAILQHPAMVYHPPILYVGLTSLVVPFAISVAALARRDVGPSWIKLTRRWLLVSWTFLSFGMVAGANWAYVELGWGGFWAWDPVENTSLMPWLAATVFLHTSRIQLRDGRLARWNALFAMLPFVLTILGVYLTRSGVTGSIHAFAESDRIGRVLLSIFILVAILSLVWVLRIRQGSPWKNFDALARDTWLAANGGLLGAALAFVLVGSAYPAYLAVFGDVRTSVDPTFFVTLVLPIAFLLLVGLAMSMQTSWTGETKLSAEFLLLGGASLGGLAISWVLFGWKVDWGFPLLVLAIGAVSVLLFYLWRDRPSGRILVGYLAHLGMALVMVGAAGSSLGDEFRGGMSLGDIIDVAGYEIRLESVETGEADRFIFVVAELTLLRDGAPVAVAKPQIRAYENQPLPIPEPVLRSTPREDIVFAVSRVNQDATGVEVNVFVRPLVLWVWVGGLLIGLAGLLALIGIAGAGAGQRRSARGELPTREATSAG